MAIKWTHIIIHHTGAEEKDTEQIRRFHIKKGWGDIGYNFVIERSGKLVPGRSLKLPGAHTKAADMNFKAIGIALIGNFELTAPTEEQLETLVSLLRELQENYGIPKENILPHNKVRSAKTLCPGKLFPFDELTEHLRVAQKFWRVQLGAFTNEQQAKKYVEYLKPRAWKFIWFIVDNRTSVRYNNYKILQLVVKYLGRVNLEQIWGDINCLFPFYAEDGGNYTKILLASGEELIDTRKTKTVLNELARFFAADLKSLRSKYGALIERKRAIPLPFHADLVLISVKVREPGFKDQGSVAYINSKGVDLVKDLKALSGPRTQIVFRNGQVVHSLQTTPTIKALLTDAGLVKTSFLNLYSSRSDQEALIKESLTNFLQMMHRIS